MWWTAQEGPRERYALEGPTDFGEVELLALVVGTGTAERSSRQIALALLERFGDVDGLAAAPVQALTAISGVGMARAVRVHAACTLGRRARRVPPGAAVRNAQQAWQVLRGRMEGLPHEELHALYLDRRGRPLGRLCLTRGSAAFTIVDPRQILRPAVELGASGLILAHNHPSGDPTPSDEDRGCTRRVEQAARTLGVSLLDHLVLGRDSYVSLAELGVLQRWPGPGVAVTG